MSIHINNIVKQSAILLALLTVTGILVHDTKVDKATAIFMTVPVAIAGLAVIPKLASDGHNHVERASLDSVSRDLQNGMPRVKPRGNKKHRLQKHVAKGAHAFDGYYMPLGGLA